MNISTIVIACAVCIAIFPQRVRKICSRVLPDVRKRALRRSNWSLAFRDRVKFVFFECIFTDVCKI